MKFIPKVKINSSLQKFDYILVGVFVFINALIAGGTYYRNIYEYAFSFLLLNYTSIVIIFLACIALFILSFRSFSKKMPSAGLLITFILILSVFFYNVISINNILESITSRASFSTGNNIFTFLSLIICGMIISRYDFPQTFNLYEYYKSLMQHFYSNIAVYISLALIIAVIGYMNTTFIYAISLVVLIEIVYLSKALLANIRR